MTGIRFSETVCCRSANAAIDLATTISLSVASLQQVLSKPAMSQVHALIVRPPLPHVHLLHTEACHLSDAHLQRLAEDCGSSGDQSGVWSEQMPLCSCQHVQHALSKQPAVKHLHTPDYASSGLALTLVCYIRLLIIRFVSTHPKCGCISSILHDLLSDHAIRAAQTRIIASKIARSAFFCMSSQAWDQRSYPIVVKCSST